MTVFGSQVPSVPVTAIDDDTYLLDVREDDEWARRATRPAPITCR